MVHFVATWKHNANHVDTFYYYQIPCVLNYSVLLSFCTIKYLALITYLSVSQVFDNHIWWIILICYINIIIVWLLNIVVDIGSKKQVYLGSSISVTINFIMCNCSFPAVTWLRWLVIKKKKKNESCLQKSVRHQADLLKLKHRLLTVSVFLLGPEDRKSFMMWLWCH